MIGKTVTTEAPLINWVLPFICHLSCALHHASPCLWLRGKQLEHCKMPSSDNSIISQLPAHRYHPTKTAGEYTDSGRMVLSLLAPLGCILYDEIEYVQRLNSFIAKISLFSIEFVPKHKYTVLIHGATHIEITNCASSKSAGPLAFSCCGYHGCGPTQEGKLVGPIKSKYCQLRPHGGGVKTCCWMKLLE